ncbi:MAG: hypothetical protein ABSF83_10975 [Nitrososphaerales archaeon]|jgi:hypothetical protein
MFEVEHDRSKRTASATFRVSEKAYRALQVEAEKQDTSLNTLVNQVFDAHVNDRLFLEKLDFMRVNKLTFRRILEGTSDQALTEAGLSSGRETIRTVTLGRGAGMTLEGLLETISALADFSGFARYSEIRSSGNRVVVLTQDLGPKWSVFIGNFVAAAFKLIDCEPKITTGDRSVVVEITTHA